MSDSKSGTKLLEKLKTYTEGDYYPFHMPGHKRRREIIGDSPIWSWDITEIPGFDDLHNAKGVIAELQSQAASLYGASYSRLLVNGSTCGILASISLCCQPGDSIIVARNCHKSVYHAIELKNLRGIYIVPAWSSHFPFSGSIRPEAVEVALKSCPQAKAVVITSPTYEGVISDLKSIAQICHSHGIPLIVDEAHGAHLAFTGKSAKSALTCGADLVIQSLHKTLPSLSQTALLHYNGNLFTPAELDHQLDIFETSSPSYPLLGSIDFCLNFLSSGSSYFAAYLRNLFDLREALSLLQNLKVYSCEELEREADFCHSYDSGKVIISTEGYLRGQELAVILREKYHLEVEMAQRDYILALTSVADSREGFQRLVQALREIDASLLSVSPKAAAVLSYDLPKPVFTVTEALKRDREVLPFSSALGSISAEYVWVYPPGIPIIVPGETISREVLTFIAACEEGDLNIVKTWRSPDGHIAVVRGS